MKRKLISIAIFAALVFAISTIRVSINVGNIDGEERIVSCGLLSDILAAKGGQGKGRGRGKDKGGKGKGRGKDKDRGPSVPAIPMAAAAIIGLGGIGAVAYFIKKKKK